MPSTYKQKAKDAREAAEEASEHLATVGQQARDRWTSLQLIRQAAVLTHQRIQASDTAREFLDQSPGKGLDPTVATPLDAMECGKELIEEICNLGFALLAAASDIRIMASELTVIKNEALQHRTIQSGRSSAAMEETLGRMAAAFDTIETALAGDAIQSAEAMIARIEAVTITSSVAAGHPKPTTSSSTSTTVSGQSVSKAPTMSLSGVPRFAEDDASPESSDHEEETTSKDGSRVTTTPPKELAPRSGDGGHHSRSAGKPASRRSVWAKR